MSHLYFAYGSNLKLERMRSRVRSARPAGLGSLAGFHLTFDKRGRDGSGKANVARRPEAIVWGALYELDPHEWDRLDAHEPGYARIAVRIATAADGWVAAQTYVARVLTANPVPFRWYKRLILEGAREHGLPDPYLAFLEGLPERPDPAVS